MIAIVIIFKDDLVGVMRRTGVTVTEEDGVGDGAMGPDTTVYTFPSTHAEVTTEGKEGLLTVAATVSLIACVGSKMSRFTFRLP